MQHPHAADNPYPGLRPFQADETHLFFGRDPQRNELLRRMGQSRLLAIVGSSGSGKSSLVRAGLLPALFGGFMAGHDGDWRIADMRPGADPLGNLARALDQPGVLRDGDQAAAVHSYTETTLRRGSLGLAQVLQEARLPAGDALLVLVDQFEELFRGVDARHSAAAQDDATAFVKLLLQVSGDARLRTWVVLTMRSDFLGDCARFRDLPEAINNGQYLIPRLHRDQIRLAITGPAAVMGARLDEPLVNRLLNDAGEQPDQLPVLQHVLMRTWDAWAAAGRPGNTLALPHYEDAAVGTMAHALERHANEVHDSLGADAADTVKTLFTALTAISDNGHPVRRLARVGDVAAMLGPPQDTAVARVLAVAAPFRAPRNALLMPPAGEAADADTYLDISHESLIRHWGLLAGWCRDEAQSAELYLRLAGQAERHAKGAAALLIEPELGQALRWRSTRRPTAAWAQRYRGQFGLAMDFLDRSAAAHQATQAERLRTRRIRNTWLALLLLVLLGGTLMRVAMDVGQNHALAAEADRLKGDLDISPSVYALLVRRMDGVRPQDMWECRQAAAGPGADAANADDADLLERTFGEHLPAVERLCESDLTRSEDDFLYLKVAMHLSNGDVAAAAAMIDTMPGRVAIRAQALMDRVAAMQTDSLHAERRELVRLDNAARARPAGPRRPGEPPAPEARRSLVSLLRLDGRSTFNHPVHKAMAAKLGSGLPLQAQERKLLDIYQRQTDQRQLSRDLDSRLSPRDCSFSDKDAAPDLGTVLAAQYFHTMCQAALQPASLLADLGQGALQMLRQFSGELLVLLTWPAWRARRAWQRRRGGAVAEQPSALRRALASLFDALVAVGLLSAGLMVSFTVIDSLSRTWLSDVADWVLPIGSMAVALAYLLLCDTVHFRHHRSLGKIAFDLRPLRNHGPQPGQLLPALSARRSPPRVLLALLLLAVLAGALDDLLLPDPLDIQLLRYPLLVGVTVLCLWLLKGRTPGDRWSDTRVVDSDSAAARAADTPPRYADGPGAAAPVAGAVRA